MGVHSTQYEGDHRKYGCNGFLMQEKYSSYGYCERKKDLMCACLMALRCLHGFTFQV